jgi:hypothetical protein
VLFFFAKGYRQGQILTKKKAPGKTGGAISLPSTAHHFDFVHHFLHISLFYLPVDVVDLSQENFQ